MLIYADDILLLSPSLSSLQLLVDLCCKELSFLDMEINYKKSVCMRIGSRFHVECSQIITSSGHILNWVQHLRYLGAYIESASLFKCDFSVRKKSFYRACNSKLGRVGRNASPEVIIELIKKKCLSSLLYGSEVLPVSSSG